MGLLRHCLHRTPGLAGIRRYARADGTEQIVSKSMVTTQGTDVFRHAFSRKAIAVVVRLTLALELSRQRLSMIGQMLADKGGDKVIAVVVAFLHAQRQGIPARLTRILQVLGIELLG